MLHELNESDYGKVRPLFLPLEFQLSIFAVLDGINPGRCFVDNVCDPSTAFLFSPEGCYLAGEPNPEFISALNKAISNQIIIDENWQMLAFVLASDEWNKCLIDVCRPRIPIIIPRRHYICREPTLEWQVLVPDGFAISRITSELLNRSGLKIPDHVHSWIKCNWDSASYFLENGFGFVSLHNDEVTSWCIADCVTGSCCEVGIHTAIDYRRLGLATVTAAATADYALSNGFSMVGWHCDDSNRGSSSTAKKVGFKMERNYTAYYVFLDEATHLVELERYSK